MTTDSSGPDDDPDALPADPPADDGGPVPGPGPSPGPRPDDPAPAPAAQSESAASPGVAARSARERNHP